MRAPGSRGTCIPTPPAPAQTLQKSAAHPAHPRSQSPQSLPTPAAIAPFRLESLPGRGLPRQSSKKFHHASPASPPHDRASVLSLPLCECFRFPARQIPWSAHSVSTLPSVPNFNTPVRFPAPCSIPDSSRQLFQFGSQPTAKVFPTAPASAQNSKSSPRETIFGMPAFSCQHSRQHQKSFESAAPPPRKASAATAHSPQTALALAATAETSAPFHSSNQHASSFALWDDL